MLSFILLGFLFCDAAHGASEHHIKSGSEFIAFANSVYYGTGYSGTTVILDSDIDLAGGLSEQFIQMDGFSGTFDGQGYTISNL